MQYPDLAIFVDSDAIPLSTSAFLLSVLLRHSPASEHQSMSMKQRPSSLSGGNEGGSLPSVLTPMRSTMLRMTNHPEESPDALAPAGSRQVDKRVSLKDFLIFSLTLV